jgi:hypothetical protein
VGADSPGVDGPDVDAGAGASLEAGSSPFAEEEAAFLAGAPDERRSFLAQPVPLKWIVGGANARMTGPSHRGHW